jgi:hypothetical protein
MDVLEHWEPSIDWSLFNQGDLHSALWYPFTQLVALCHAYKHWDDVAKNIRRERPPAPLYPESRYGRTKRKNEHRSLINSNEDHKYRAAYLAAEKISTIRSLFIVGSAFSFSPEGPEWKCYLAVEFAVESRPRHESGHYRAVAFDSFDAKVELLGDPFPIAQRWRMAARDPLIAP